MKIVGGSYKPNGKGTFIRYHGTMRAWVRVDGDSQPERNLFLASIKKAKRSTVGGGPTTEKDQTAATTDDTTVRIKRDEYNRLLKDIDGLSADLEAVKNRLKNLEL